LQADLEAQRLRDVTHTSNRWASMWKERILSKRSTYETAIERQLNRALHQLERRQAARRGAALTLPQVLDVEVSGMPEEAPR
jgi:hypothetical protein